MSMYWMMRPRLEYWCREECVWHEHTDYLNDNLIWLMSVDPEEADMFVDAILNGAHYENGEMIVRARLSS